MTVRAGRLRHRLELQEDQGTRDAVGEAVPNWVTIREVWAAVEPLQGRELIEASQIHEQANTRIVTRYHRDITPAHRFRHVGKHQTRVWDIKSVVSPSERNVEMQMFCNEVS